MNSDLRAKLIDTHCHLDFPDFDHDREAVIEKARQEAVAYIINIGSSLDASKRALELAQRYDFIYATLGLHPHEAQDCSLSALEELKALARNRRVVAIGEIGLDYYFREPPRKGIKTLQESLFRTLIGIARERGLPLVIHSRDADSDLLRILKDEYKDGKIRGVVHCFSSDEQFLKTCLELGLCVSFTCNITYKKADNLRYLVKVVPLNRLLLETDAPFLSPQVCRGMRNEPANVKILAEEIARIKNLDFNEVAETTTRNAKELFSLE